MGTTGVLYLATDPGSRAKLELALAGLRRHEPGAPVVVVRDGSTGWASRRLKTRAPALVPPEWAVGVLLDVDTMVEGPLLEALAAAVTAPGARPVAMARNFPATTAGDEMGKPCFRGRMLGRQAWAAWAETVPPEWPVWNTGVIAWRAGEEARAFFARWFAAWEEWPPGPDQVALARARLRPSTLPPRFNFPMKPIRSLRALEAARRAHRPAVLHGYGLGRRYLERVRALGLVPEEAAAVR